MPYPNAEAVMNRARAFVNDAFRGGAGRILTDQNPFTVEFLNGALEFLQDRIRNRGVITLEYDNVILSPITPAPTAQPGTQQQVAYNGFFDGATWHATPALPANCVSVLELSERQTGSGLPFQPMKQLRPLPDRFPGPWLVNWEYRQDRIILLGSTVSEDLRIRYQSQLTPIAPATAQNPLSNVTIQILCSINSLAHIVAYFYARALGASAAPTMQADAEVQIKLLTNRYTRQNQRTLYRRRGFGFDNIGRINLPW